MIAEELNFNIMEEKINYWEKEKQETLDKLENAKYAKDSLLIMQYKIQLDIIESHLYKLKNG
jgi:hypothetical protein